MSERTGTPAMEPIAYRSTNGEVRGASLRRALLEGQAPDQGLYMPERFPWLGASKIRELASRPYPDVAFEVLRGFAAGTMADERLFELCRDAYDFEVPLERVTERLYVLRLDRGPTASFKDFAARMMGRMLGSIVREEKRRLLILTATSGDTGSAVAHAFHGVPGIDVLVLFPIAEVSGRQRKQMTTVGGNVATIALEGKFDDCQALVKRAFADPALASLNLSSANSINVGRLLPQAAYYVYACARLAAMAPEAPIVVSVPCGNFGNITGGLIAKAMGLDVARFVVATNENDEVPRFFATGQYRKIEPSRACISNAMNVGHPSNLARLVDLYGGRMDEKGTVRALPDLSRIRRELFAVSVSDAETRRTIREAYDEYGLLLEPHGAVAWAGLKRLLESGEAPAGSIAVSVETAHPAKFPEEIRAILSIEPALPPSLAGLESLEERYDRLPADYERFREVLLERYGSRSTRKS